MKGSYVWTVFKKKKKIHQLFYQKFRKGSRKHGDTLEKLRYLVRYLISWGCGEVRITSPGRELWGLGGRGGIGLRPASGFSVYAVFLYPLGASILLGRVFFPNLVNWYLRVRVHIIRIRGWLYSIIIPKKKNNIMIVRLDRWLWLILKNKLMLLIIIIWFNLRNGGGQSAARTRVHSQVLFSGRIALTLPPYLPTYLGR